MLGESTAGIRALAKKHLIEPAVLRDWLKNNT